MGICSTTPIFLLLCYAFAGFLLPVSSSPISDLVCHYVNCGQGNCTESKGTLLPFDCYCNDGWKKMQMGAFVLPPCVIPNCHLDLSCGSPSSYQTGIPPMSTFNITNPCSYTFCGDGTCLAQDETSYQCNCNIGSINMLNLARLPCVRRCALQRDCQALLTGISQSPPPLLWGSSQSPPPLLSLTAPRTPSYASDCGENCTAGTVQYNFSRKKQAPLGLMLLIFIFILQV